VRTRTDAVWTFAEIGRILTNEMSKLVGTVIQVLVAKSAGGLFDKDVAANRTPKTDASK